MRFPRIDYRLPLACLSGALLALAYPMFDINIVAWFALAPLAWVLIDAGAGGNDGASGTGFAPGFAAGFAFFLVTLYWLLAIPIEPFYWALLLLGYVLLSAYLALYFGAWSAGFMVFTRVIGVGGMARRIALCALGAALWVALEWVRSWMFTGFPWNFLGVSQHRAVPLIQIASVTGVYGVSFWLCFVNLALTFTARRVWQRSTGKAETAQREPEGEDRLQSPARRRALNRTPAPFSKWGSQISWEFTVSMLLVMGLAMSGLKSLQRSWELPTRSMPVALVQGNVPQGEKWDEAFKQRILADYIRLTEQAAATSPALIVWPETATPEPALRVVQSGPGGARAIRYIPENYDALTRLARETGSHLLVGTLDVTGDTTTRGTGNLYNSAFLVTPEGVVEEPYRKMRLVPFGEYVPFERWLPFMRRLTPIQGSFASASDYRVFDLPEPPATFGVVICFEDVMPDHCRRFVKSGADFLVTITNDAWFGRTAGAYQHSANSVFRAVENRRPLLRCGNTGVTCVLDGHGRLLAVLKGRPEQGVFIQGALTHTVDVPVDPPQTFYTAHGDVFARACAGLSALALALCVLVARRKRSG